MNVIELFSGSGVISRKFRERGHNVFSIDIRKRKGICEPDLRKDIMRVTLRDIPFEKVDVVWASPPCDVFSKAAGHFHWKGNIPITPKCLEHIYLLKKTLKLIERIKPGTFFVENPDGKMKYMPDLVNFLIRNNAMTKKAYYSLYGFGTLKPTTIFTNALDYNPRNNKLDTSENNRVIFDNLTKCQKQAIPEELAEEIVGYCEEKYGPRN